MQSTTPTLTSCPLPVASLALTLLVTLSCTVLSHAHSHGGKHGDVLDAKHVNDQEHLKEHLKEQIDVTKMSEADQQFYYFKVHDSDNNDKLDGIELSNAMAHYHDEEQGESKEEYTETELGSMVDQILDEDDLNKDGYIDYPEFIQSQQRDEADDTKQEKQEEAKQAK